jgi:hypothetical protein
VGGLTACAYPVCHMTRFIPFLALMLLAGCLQQPSRIRVQNLTGLDFSSVTVMTNSFGSVKAGALTEYQSAPAVFEDVSVYTRQEDGHFWNHRFIGGANDRIASGRYTYVLTLDKNALEISRQKD